MSLEWLLSDLSKRYDIQIPEKDKKGFYSLDLGLHHSIIVQNLEPGVYFSSRLVPPPGRNREELFIYLMKANFLGQGTGGGVIGMEKDEKFLTLSLTMPYEVNFTIFKENLEDFINFVEFWQEEIQKYKKG